MKREGRQHGMVRAHSILPPRFNSRSGPITDVFDSPPTAGYFTRVNSSKPTNHSKFTGMCSRPRCRGCHSLPAEKSMTKTKGMYKVKRRDVGLEWSMVTWRVMDSGPGMVFGTGSSASGILAQWDDDDIVEMDDEDEVQIEDRYEMNGVDYDCNNDDLGCVWEQVEGDESWCLVTEM